MTRNAWSKQLAKEHCDLATSKYSIAQIQAVDYSSQLMDIKALAPILSFYNFWSTSEQYHHFDGLAI
jgi:hypothetical protein